VHARQQVLMDDMSERKKIESSLPFPSKALPWSCLCVLLRALQVLADNRVVYMKTTKQLTHGDLNPGNIMVNMEAIGSARGRDGDLLVSVCDFTPYSTESHLYSFMVFCYWTFLYRHDPTHTHAPTPTSTTTATTTDATVNQSIYNYHDHWDITGFHVALSTYVANYELDDTLKDVPVSLFMIKVACRMLLTLAFFHAQPSSSSTSDVKAATSQATTLPSFVTTSEMHHYASILEYILSHQKDFDVTK
jgi:hypothetical protein